MAKYITDGFISDVIDGIGVDSSLKCNASNYNNNAGRNVSYIVMHYTGNPKDTARANCNYYSGAGARQASAHLFVDDTSIYQSVELRDTAWHCGTSGTYYHSACRNACSIGIEMCCTAGNYRVSETTKRHAAHLCAFLCRKIGVSASEVDTYVVRHYDVTHKSCPAQMAGEGNAEWAAFKNMVKQILGGAAPAPAPTPSAPAVTNVAAYNVKVTADDGLNVRSGPGTNYPVVASLKPGDVVTISGESNGWGKLQSGAGFVSLAYTAKVNNAPASTPTATSSPSYKVKITADVLNIRKGPGANNAKVGSVKRGEVYTIVQEQSGWGKLKSGVGWISLEFTTRV